MEASKLEFFHIPQDKELLTALGEVTLRHEHMNYIIIMTIMSLENIIKKEDIAATAYHSAGQLRDRVKKLAKKQLGEGEAFLRLQAHLSECRRLTEKRNRIIHGLYTQELDGEAWVHDARDDGRRPLPTSEEVYDLASEIKRLTDSLNHERLEGFLKDALSKT